jgi:hypothetical protein
MLKPGIIFRAFGFLNLDYKLGFVMRAVIAIKSDCLKTEASYTYWMKNGY